MEIKKTEERKVTLTSTVQDENGNAVMSLSASIGNGPYECGTVNKQFQNKAEYFKNLAKYKVLEKEFETEYEKVATDVLSTGGSNDGIN